jgi:gliding motility-associated transport system ATP-binding protein
MSIEVNQLTKKYGNQKAIDCISFNVEEGEILGFLGPNGAGKSTMMKIATGFIPPSEGEVRIAGFDVVIDAMDVRKNIGYLPEHNPLYPDMYVHEYLSFIASLHGLKGKAKGNRIKRMVDLCGLTIEQNKKIGTLSKGYRQRVGLAQALIHDPKVLILDEPTTGLDPNQLAEIRALIKQISKDKTVILSTHIMQEVKALCNRVIIINHGKIVANDTVDHLSTLSNGHVLNVEFQKHIDSEVLSELKDVEILSSDGINFKLKSDQDIREALFKFAADKGWIILSMKAEEADLETVFYQLTKGKA